MPTPVDATTPHTPIPELVLSSRLVAPATPAPQLLGTYPAFASKADLIDALCRLQHPVIMEFARRVAHSDARTWTDGRPLTFVG